MRAILYACALAGALAAFGCDSSGVGGGAQTAGGISPEVAVKRPNTRFVTATIERRFDASGQMTNDKLTIHDPEELAELEAFFPDAGAGARGPEVGGWSPAVIVQFKPLLGRTIRVMSNYEVWSEGTGDWPAKRALKDHVERLFAHRQAT